MLQLEKKCNKIFIQLLVFIAFRYIPGKGTEVKQNKNIVVLSHTDIRGILNHMLAVFSEICLENNTLDKLSLLQAYTECVFEIKITLVFVNALNDYNVSIKKQVVFNRISRAALRAVEMLKCHAQNGKQKTLNS